MTNPPQNAAAESGATAAPGEAVADMRATARWTIAAVAAVGALLLGGAPLTAVGKVNDAGDALAAFVGLALALAGVGWAIWQTGEVLTPRFTTIAELDRPAMSGLRRIIAQDKVAFYGPFGQSPEALRAACLLHETTWAKLAVTRAKAEDQAEVRVLEQALDDARANAALARRLEGRLVDLIHAWEVRVALRRARVHTLVAMFLVAIGAVLFLTATIDNAPRAPAKPVPNPTSSPA
ncbi:hypothetical protein BKA00_005784 [Actinomadura coerulea]|uniref:Uncharacterized protein n=1 Tax=Actinomadura coerulea TaxID=46159 RepID=A0A7X0G3N7_9ACTN|nr:hypothetical protein [Actinomadura coerulea]MBB6398870.1 hypothetical protein [Actinomadura coerulea]GGP98630.1 hypothetical protein GCM10010187_12850 [Actinomadura coerulea]